MEISRKLVKAWQQHKKTQDYKMSIDAMYANKIPKKYGENYLWAAFEAGWKAANIEQRKFD